MIYPYAVKHNGRFYSAGEEVPETGTSKTEPKQETIAQVIGESEAKHKVGRKPKTEE